MTVTRPQRIREIFNACLGESTPDARAAVASRESGGDEQLHTEVLRLLVALEGLDSFLERPVMPLEADEGSTQTLGCATASRQSVESFEAAGTLVGPYKLREQIGEGGFGVVFVAEQQHPLRRMVALKVIKPGMDSRQIIARFEAERQALAMMDHPNIAKVLDAGTTENGRPYFVMELVRGVYITQFCDQQKLSVADRLRLFVDVCHAVQHAHQKGIIHRDLKPSNILVTMRDDRPVVKVIDFGVAKALNQRLTENTIYTHFGQMIGTPMYMSPEQAQMNELDVDTRSDVYSLGVLLYVMLTGSPPFDPETVKRATYDDLRRMICDSEPLRPSQRVQTLPQELASTVADQRQIDLRHLSRHLRGELDWIVMKTLEKDRNRRYESVGGLARDVQRYLTDEPVEARPQSLTYRFGKLARRHKLGLAAGAVAIVVPLAAIVGLSMANTKLSEARRQTEDALRDSQENYQLAKDRAAELLLAQQIAEAERQQAEVHYRQSIEIVKQLVDKITEWNLAESPGMNEYRIQLLESAHNSLKDLHQARPNDKQASPLPVEVMFALAKDYAAMQRIQEGLKMYESAVAAADALAREGSTRGPDYHRLQWEIRYSFYFLLRKNSRRDDALRELRAAITILERALTHDQKSKVYRVQLCNLLSALAGFEAESGDILQARKHLIRVGQILELHLDDNLRPKTSLAESHVEALISEGIAPNCIYMFLGILADRQDDLDSRVALRKLAVHAGRIEVQQTSARAARHNFAYHVHLLASVLRQAGNLEEALQRERESLTVLERLSEEFSDLVIYRNDLVRGTAFTATILTAMERTSEAVTMLDRLIERYPTAAAAYETRGDLHAKVLKDSPRAIADYERAIELDPSNYSAHYSLYGFLMYYARPDHWDRRRALSIAKKLTELQPERANSWVALASANGELGNTEECLAAAHQSLSLTPTDSEKAYAFRWIAEMERTRGRYAEALATGDKAVAAGPREPTMWGSRGDTFYLMGQYKKALDDLNHAIELAPGWGHLYKRRARCLFHLAQYNEALQDLARAVELTPHDGSTLYWISPAQVAECPDTSFREGMLELADQMVQQSGIAYVRMGRATLLSAFGKDELALGDFNQAVTLEPKNASRWSARASFFADRRRWSEAASDLAKIVELTPDDCLSHYRHALAALAAGDDEQFHNACRQLLRNFQDSDRDEFMYFAAWTCALAPVAVEDFAPAIALVRKAVERQPRKSPYLTALGAVLFRAGQDREAKEQLEKVLAEPEQKGESRAYAAYFLAMIEQRLGNHDAAQQQLEEADCQAERERFDDAAWNRKLTLELLGREADAMIRESAMAR